LAALVAWTAGGALLLGSAVAGALALKTRADLLKQCSPELFCDASLVRKRDRGEQLVLATDLLLGAGIASAAVGVVLFFALKGDPRERPAADGPTASVACGPGGCAGSLSVRF